MEMSLFSLGTQAVHPSFKFEGCGYALLLRRRALSPLLDTMIPWRKLTLST
jgi:hypothetical protein